MVLVDQYTHIHEEVLNKLASMRSNNLYNKYYIDPHTYMYYLTRQYLNKKQVTTWILLHITDFH